LSCCNGIKEAEALNTGGSTMDHTNTGSDRIYRTSCRHCHCECGVLVTLENGKAVKIRGDKENPVTKGHICPKGLASLEIAYHPDRLRFPLRRTRGGWERISWDDALDLTAEKLLSYRDKFGPESLLLLHGTARGGWFSYFIRFAHAFRTPNWGEPGWSQCFMPRLQSSILTYGSALMECPDIENTKCIMVWGANPPATWPSKWARMQKALNDGTKLIVVDPVEIGVAKKADLFLQLRPSTDAALAMGILNVLINEGYYNRKFVEVWTKGFEKLKDRVQEYDPRTVEKITWVPAEKIRKAAEMMAVNSPSSIFQCVAIDQNNNTTQTSRAIALIPALTGNVDNPGGNIAPMKTAYINGMSNENLLVDTITDEMYEKRLGASTYRLLGGKHALSGGSAHIPTAWDAILSGEPYPIKAGVVFGSEAVVSWANSKKVEKALKALEFIVTADLFMTRTAELSDLVLPAATWLECDDITDSLQATVGDLYARQKVIEIPECRPDREIILDLAKRLGLHEYYPWDTDEQFLDSLLKPVGYTFAKLKKESILRVPFEYYKHQKGGFATPSGKIELYCDIMEELEYDPLPFHVEPFESPDDTSGQIEKYPFILTTGGRVVYYRHAEMRQVKSLRKHAPHPLAEVNNRTAEDLGVVDGDKLIISSPRGSIEVIARVSDRIHPRVVQVCPGWGGKANVNILTDDKLCSPEVGTTPLRGLMCNIEKAENEGDAIEQY
jgi:thiosulfate reductase / polysulfide reductase chain A